MYYYLHVCILLPLSDHTDLCGAYPSIVFRRLKVWCCLLLVMPVVCLLRVALAKSLKGVKLSCRPLT